LAEVASLASKKEKEKDIGSENTSYINRLSLFMLVLESKPLIMFAGLIGFC